MGALKEYYHEELTYDYLSSEEFDLLTEDQIDTLNWDYYQSKLEDVIMEEHIAEKEAMETDYQYCK
jgi:hypothetical protein